MRKTNNKLIFSEYSPEEIEGLQNDILMNMHVAPRTPREKAFSALIYLKADKINTMLLWEGSFEFTIYRRNKQFISNNDNQNILLNPSPKNLHKSNAHRDLKEQDNEHLERKLNDHNWLKKDGQGRLEYCANFLKANNKIIDGIKILDVGCGRGTLAHYLDSNIDFHGIDISEKAISEARKLYKQADCVDLNRRKLPYADKFFDISIALDVIEHVFDPLFFLREIYRVIKPRGELILSTPNILNENLLMSFVRNRRFPKTSGDSTPYDGGHIHFFTYEDIFDLMKKVGFNFKPIGPLKDAFDYEFKESMAWVLGKKL